MNRAADSSGAGFTATSNVFWNIVVKHNHPLAHACAVETAQWAWGYAIGTSAAPGSSAAICTTAVTNSRYAAADQGLPVDFAEGEHAGATLSPASLYERQRAMRCARQSLMCD